jgi:anti-sigma regulatory factor (Ser/Thr protein kinase)
MGPVNAPPSDDLTDVLRLELTLPARPAYVATARAFVAAAARHFGAEEEAVADLKVAVSEACSGAVRVSDSGITFHIAVDAEPHQLTVEIVTPTEPPLDEPASPVDLDLAPREFEEAIRATLIDALFPEASFERRDGGLAVSFAVSLLPPE